MKLGLQVGLVPGYIVLGGDPAPPSLKGLKGHNPLQFSAHICCGQMVAWIKIPLGMELGLGPGDFVLDGDPAPHPKKRAEPSNFRPMFIVAKRLDGSRWYLAWRWASAQAILCLMGTQPAPKFSAHIYYSYL